jgi:hypothetical protein
VTLLLAAIATGYDRAVACRPAAGVSSPCQGPSHFSLLAQRKVTKRKSTPVRRLPGLLPGRSVRLGRAFRRGSCPGEKCPASLPGTLRAFSSEPHRRTGAPEERRASCAHFSKNYGASARSPSCLREQESSGCAFPMALDSSLRALLSGLIPNTCNAHRAFARHSGAGRNPVAVRLERAWSLLDDSLRSPLRGRPSGVLRAARLSGLRRDDEPDRWSPLEMKSSARSTSCKRLSRTRSGNARKARLQGAFSLGYFSLGKQREATRPPEGGRNTRPKPAQELRG